VGLNWIKYIQTCVQQPTFHSWDSKNCPLYIRWSLLTGYSYKLLSILGNWGSGWSL
jgi:hypothetical protein